MKYKTTTTNVQADGTEIVRGYALKEIIENRTFSETIFLMLTSRFPSDSERRMMDAMLSAIIDNGPAVTSAQCARLSASAGNTMHTALAAGVLGFGDRHGVALEGAMRFMMENVGESNVAALVARLKEKKVRIPGYGHKVFTSEDPRSTVLFEKAETLGIAGKYVVFAKQVHTELNAISSKSLPINIDGALAALLCDMGFDPMLGRGFFVIGRMPGLVAQVHEELTADVGIRRLAPEDVVYSDPEKVAS
jgi:citryl-CoA lyase